jgi:hypothetical protein
MKRLYLFLPIVIALELFLWNLPREIVHHDSNLVRGIAMFGTVFVFIPGFMAMALSKLKSKNWMMIAILSIPINGMGFATSIGRNEDKELQKDGVLTKGIVIDTKSVNIKTVSYDWAVKVEYTVVGATYLTNWEGDYSSSIERGDSIEIVYLPDYPKVYKIKDESTK